MADRIQQRRDTKARWEQFNPVLLEGEVGYVLDDVNKYKIGDGIHAWNDLSYRGFDGTIAQETGNSENAVMSQKAVTEKLSELGSEVGVFSITKQLKAQTGNQMIVSGIDISDYAILEIKGMTLNASTLAVGYTDNGSTDVVYKTFTNFKVGDKLEILLDGQTLDRIVIIDVSVSGILDVVITNRTSVVYNHYLPKINNSIIKLEVETNRFEKSLLDYTHSKELGVSSGNQYVLESSEFFGAEGNTLLTIKSLSLTAGDIYITHHNINTPSVQETNIINNYKEGDCFKILNDDEVLEGIIINNVSVGGGISINLKSGVYYSIDNLSTRLLSKTEQVRLFKSNKNEYVSSVILDAQISSIYSESSIYLEYILKNTNIGGTIYNSVNIKLIKDDVSYGGIYNSKTNGVGIELIEVNDAYLSGYVIVNWDALPQSINVGLNQTAEFSDVAKKQHIGLVDLYTNKTMFVDTLSYDQFYILDNKLVCNNDHKNDVQTVAKYAKVDMGSTVKKAMCRFTTKGNSLALITTKNNTKNNVTDITSGSVHLVFSTTCVNVGVYSGSWPAQTIYYSNPLVEDDNSEYEVGMEFMGNNVLRVYLPDKTYIDVTVENLDAYNGQYFIFETFVFKEETEFLTNDFYRPSFTGIFCLAENGVPLQDNFKRGIGALTISPSGHTYKCFRNYVESDSIYDMSNGIV